MQPLRRVLGAHSVQRSGICSRGRRRCLRGQYISILAALALTACVHKATSGPFSSFSPPLCHAVVSYFDTLIASPDVPILTAELFCGLRTACNPDLPPQWPSEILTYFATEWSERNIEDSIRRQVKIALGPPQFVNADSALIPFYARYHRYADFGYLHLARGMVDWYVRHQPVTDHADYADSLEQVKRIP